MGLEANPMLFIFRGRCGHTIKRQPFGISEEVERECVRTLKKSPRRSAQIVDGIEVVNRIKTHNVKRVPHVHIFQVVIYRRSIDIPIDDVENGLCRIWSAQSSLSAR